MKPDDIPQGVWDAAASVGNYATRYYTILSAARAIMAEREACAEISDRYVERDGVDAWARGYRCAGAGISQEIRSRP